jgi:hypothetical protein
VPAQAGTHTKALVEEARTSGKYPICVTETCRKAMRPAKSYAWMHPGAVRIGRNGKCERCTYPKKVSTKPKMASPTSPYVPLTDAERTAHNRMNLVTYMASRGRGAGLKPEPQLV